MSTYSTIHNTDVCAVLIVLVVMSGRPLKIQKQLWFY